MKKIKTLKCSCGEDVYEDDRVAHTPKGMVTCINCDRHHSEADLKEEDVVEIKEPG